jgi:hypothetical protein
LSKKAQNCTKNARFLQKSARFLQIFTKKYEKIPIFHHFLRVYPELFEGQMRFKPTQMRQIEQNVVFLSPVFGL